MQGSLYLESAYFYNWNIYSAQVIISIFWKFFEIGPSLPVVDSARVVTFAAEFVVVVATDDDIVLVIIFGPSLPHFEFSFAILLPHGLLRLFLLSTLMFHFQLFETSLLVLLLLLLHFIGVQRWNLFLYSLIYVNEIISYADISFIAERFLTINQINGKHFL